ncbi:MAG TPA: PEP-CTERM sorting domain-containing protein [Thiobacillus sp.]|nr:PEP-CTERM sorting domain-containing protein [Thiobacillus sp.]
MKFTMTKIAAGLALAVAASGAQAVTVNGWDLGDFNNDGLMSDFAFFSAPSGSSGNKFAPTNEMCGGGDCAAIATNGSTQGTGTFSMGFNFGGTGMFSPFTYGTGVQADITGGVLTFTSLDFGGFYNGVNFFLEPDNLANVTSTVTDLGSGDYGVVVRYVGTINEPASAFNGFAANWRLEGVMHTATAPVPEASTYGMMLAGLGLVGFAVRRRKLMA